jgi:hypothetical protein
MAAGQLHEARGSPAPPDSLLPLATLLAPPTNEAPLLSPDGRWVSFLRPVDGR